MTKHVSGVLIVAALVLVCIGLAAQGCSKQSTKAITEELANDMTDEMKFSGGTVKTGNPPPEHSGEAGYPQSSITSAPSTLMLGQTFAVQVKQSGVTPSTDGGLGVRAASTDGVGTVTGAVVYINLATKYIQVTASVDSKGVMILTGQIEFDANLADVEATIKIAMQQSDGSVGNYSEWKLVLRQSSIDCQEYCNKAIECGEETDLNGCMTNCNVFYHWVQDSYLDAVSSCISISSCMEANTCMSKAYTTCSTDSSSTGAINAYCQLQSKCFSGDVSTCVSEWTSGGFECLNSTFWNNMQSCLQNYTGDCNSLDTYFSSCMGLHN